MIELDAAGAALRIWANLDCEAQWGNAKLRAHVRRRISAASVLLAGFATRGEPVEIFAPAPVDPARIHLANVTMRVGTPERWDVAWADPAARAVNDRRFALALREELGVPLPGARVIESLAQLDEQLEAIRCPRWVCKAPWTAAGRDRAHGRGMVGDRVYIARLLERCGAVVFEPWLERIFDLGVTASVTRGSVSIDGIHTLLTDPRGGFAGIDLAPPPLSDEETSRMQFVVRAVGRHLALAGYAGPFSVDAFVYRDGDRRVLHPICEINARYTFGHVAHCFALRLGTRRLGLGLPPYDARVLVTPGDDDPSTAWVS